MSHQFLITVPKITALLDKLVSAVFAIAKNFISSGRKKARSNCLLRKLKQTSEVYLCIIL